MAEAKTQVTDIDPADFIAAVEPERKREEAKVLDTMFRKVTGEKPQMWGPSIIGYGAYDTTYESGREVHWMRCWRNLANTRPARAASTSTSWPMWTWTCWRNCCATTGRQWRGSIPSDQMPAYHWYPARSSQ